MKAAQHPAYPIEQRRVTKMSDRVRDIVASGLSADTWQKILTERDPGSQALVRRARQVAQGLVDADAEANPVRARFDVRHPDTKQAEKYYIGVQDMEMPDEGVHVLDWRAPIASLFYDSDCGPTTYLGPDNVEFPVTLLLRRALQIEKGRLKEIGDLDVLDSYRPDDIQVVGTLTADEYLTSILNSPAGNTLREIIGTIQREQHQLIREPRDRPLVLQAVAGSGKSTIALHRLAQILYDLRRRELPVGKVAVFGPNPILVKYISRLLPALQEHEVTHQTLTDWALSVLFPRRRKGTGEFGAKPVILAREEMDEPRHTAAVAKGTFAFLEALERHLARTAERTLPRADVQIGPSLVCPKDLVWQWYQSATDLPYERRLRYTADQMEIWARNEAAKLADRLEATATQWLQEVERCFPIGPKQRNYKKDAQKQLNQARGDLLQAVSVAVHTITSRWQMGNLRELYLSLITQAGTLAAVLPWSGERSQEFCRANRSVRRQRWDEGDLSAVMYLYTRVYGVTKENRWAHVVVDEGQDWSPVCYAVLRHWVQDESVTIVGDLAQGITGGAGVMDWEELRGRVFGESTLQVRQITRSYRLTRQTLDLGLTVQKNGGLAVAVGLDAIRRGEAPDLLKCADQADEEKAVLAFARRHLGKQWSVAVVTPDMESAKAWHAVLKRNRLPVSLIGKEELFEGRVTVTPVLLAKGLEFDYVAVVGAGPSAYPAGREAAKQLYVAITRAKQRVLVTAQRKLSPLLPGGEAEDPAELKDQPATPKRRRTTTASDAQVKKSVKKSSDSAERPKLTAAKKETAVAVQQEDTLRSMQEKAEQILNAIRQNGFSRSPGIVDFLRSSGVSFVDLRSNGGALWIIGGREHGNLISQLAAQGWRFKFVAGGSRTTGNQDAWFTKQDG